MDAQAVYRIERLNYILSAAAIAVAFIVWPQSVALGVLVGAVVSSVNFSIVRRLVQKLVRASARDKQVAAALFLPKMLGLLAVVGVSLWLLPISPIGFVAGFSIFFLSIAIETVRFWTTAAAAS